jgi:chaperonin cofactor prefoldin
MDHSCEERDATNDVSDLKDDLDHVSKRLEATLIVLNLIYKRLEASERATKKRLETLESGIKNLTHDVNEMLKSNKIYDT